MKLVEILGRELEQWPNTVLKMVQNISSKIEGYGESCGHIDPATDCWNGRDYTGFYHESESLASDWRTAIITRADWEAERARIKGEKAMPKANKYGWVRHRGGKCPVEKGALVDVRYRDGTFGYKLEAGRDYHFDTEHHSGWDAHFDYWYHDGISGDIMAWRPHKPSILDEPGEPNDALKEVIELDSPSIAVGRVYRHEGDPRVMRDRIREIDASSKEEEARHCAAMAAYDEERTSLVARLKAEGFALLDEPNGVVESAHQDMSDPANWEVGDIFVISESMKDDHEFAEGTIVRLTSFDDGAEDYIGTFEYQDGRDYWFCRKESVKWHSRPSS